MLEAITSAFTTVISWIGNFVTALTTTEGALNALLPIFAIGIAVSVLFLAIKALKSIVWGA